MKEQYPEKIYATEKVGTNGINCLDYRNYNEDVEYVRADIFDTEVERRIAERMPTEGEIKEHIIDRYGKAYSEFEDGLIQGDENGCEWFRSRMKGGEK